MGLTVHYLRDLANPASQCWTLIPFAQDLEGATGLAREGYADVRMYMGATGFRIVDETGKVWAEESRPRQTR